MNIDENAQIPDEYLRFKVPEIDKTALKQALKQGTKIAGVSIVKNQNIQIS